MNGSYLHPNSIEHYDVHYDTQINDRFTQEHVTAPCRRYV